MTRDVTPDLAKVRLFLTEPHPCSYLRDRSATTAFVDPALPISSDLYARLSEHGFRRSGKFLYIPRCQGCAACIPARIPVAEFIPNRQQRRCLKKNADIKLSVLNRIDGDEHFSIYEQYIHQRHSDGDMYPPNRSQYDDFIGSTAPFTRFLEFRKDGRLLAASVADILDNGLSAIYTYFDPSEDQRSLGAFAILSMINFARQNYIPHVYLGYWIDGCRKMRYKTQYQPVELLVEGAWTPYNSLDSA
ncbi:arginyltransferase [Porticoccaceae bacterium LTM1]|nr:arginyltransferase [Porticoccaceae bacterium LTM1]